MNVCDELNTLFEGIHVKMESLGHLFNCMNAIARSNTETSAKENDFLSVRDEMVSIGQYIADKIQGNAAEMISRVVSEFPVTLLGALSNLQSAPKLLDADILERCDVWLKEGDYGYLITGNILRDFNTREWLDDSEHPPLIESQSYETYYTGKVADLYVPSVLANTVGYYNALLETDNFTAFVNELNAAQRIFNKMCDRYMKDLHDFGAAVQSKEFAFLMANAPDSPTTRVAITDMLTKGVKVFHGINLAITALQNFVTLYNSLIPNIDQTLSTVKAALDVYQNHSEVQF